MPRKRMLTDEERVARRREAVKRYRAKPEAKAKAKAYWERVRDKNLITNRARYLKNTYGITAGEYATMLAAQHGRCAICAVAQTEVPRRFAVDHCHETGKVRELLCFHCNSSMGKFKDDPELLEKAANYLRKHRAQGL